MKPGYLPPEEGFLGLDRDRLSSSKPSTSRQLQACLIPFGLEKSVSYGRGTARGPAAILAASHQVELFDEALWCEPAREFTLMTQAPTEIAPDLPRALEQIENLVAHELEQNRFPLVLGGEHALTIGAVRPFAERYKDLVILHFDAHADLRDGYLGQHFSHASAMRRALDLPSVSVVSLGVRSISSEEVCFYENNRDRLDIAWAKDRHHWDLEKILGPLAGRPVYLSFDVDVFDSSLMPATGTPEPGGLFYLDVLDILSQAAQISTLVGADLVELAPIETLPACDILAAKIAYKILTCALLPASGALPHTSRYMRS